MAGAAKLHRAEERRRRGQILLEGPKLVREALAAGAAIEQVFALIGDAGGAAMAASAGAELIRVSPEALRRLSTTRSPQSPVAVARRPPATEVGHEAAIVLWDVRDPGNAGTLIRTAGAFGLAVLVTGDHSVDVWSPKVLRAAMGAHFHTGVRVSSVDVSWLHDQGYHVVAAVPSGGRPLWRAQLGARPALLIGDESTGLPDGTIRAADETVTIPMLGGAESLNAAVAGAILAYEWSRRVATARD